MSNLLAEAVAKGLLDYSLVELQARHEVANDVLRKAINLGDPRASEPERQARLLNAALIEKERQARVERGEAEPPEVVVQLEPIVLKVTRG